MWFLTMYRRCSCLSVRHSLQTLSPYVAVCVCVYVFVHPISSHVLRVCLQAEAHLSVVRSVYAAAATIARDAQSLTQLQLMLRLAHAYTVGALMQETDIQTYAHFMFASFASQLYDVCVYVYVTVYVR